MLLLPSAKLPPVCHLTISALRMLAGLQGMQPVSSSDVALGLPCTMCKIWHLSSCWVLWDSCRLVPEPAQAPLTSGSALRFIDWTGLESCVDMMRWISSLLVHWLKRWPGQVSGWTSKEFVLSLVFMLNMNFLYFSCKIYEKHTKCR